MNPVDALLRYPLFALLGRPVLQAWHEAGRTTTLEPGQAFLDEGQKGRHVCVLLSGRVRVTRADDDGRERTLGVLDQPGTVFGEYALLPPHRNTATCRAAEPSRVRLLPLSLLEPVLKTMPAVRKHLKRWLRLHALVHDFRHSAGLCFLTALSLMPLLDRGREMPFSAGRTVQATGLLDDGWLFVQRGAVRVGDGADARTLLAGDCFGEAALTGKTDPPTAVAAEDTACWYLSRAEFERPLDSPVSESVQTVNPAERATAREWVRQRGPADCGVAALAMAFREMGADVTFEQLAARTRLTDAGASVAELVATAAAFGVRAVPVRIDADQLAVARLPAVAHLHSGHFVTLFEYRVRDVVVGDPAKGVHPMLMSAFRRDWSGTTLLLGHLTEPSHG